MTALCFVRRTSVSKKNLITPIKRSNAQHMVEKQLLYEENKKWGNVMKQPMDSYVCGINTRSESILIRLYLLFT